MLTTLVEQEARLVLAVVVGEFRPGAVVDLVAAAEVQITNPVATEGLAVAVAARLARVEN